MATYNSRMKIQQHQIGGKELLLLRYQTTVLLRTAVLKEVAEFATNLKSTTAS
jgi:hypothetical protein